MPSKVSSFHWQKDELVGVPLQLSGSLFWSLCKVSARCSLGNEHLRPCDVLRTLAARLAATISLSLSSSDTPRLQQSSNPHSTTLVPCTRSLSSRSSSSSRRAPFSPADVTTHKWALPRKASYSTSHASHTASRKMAISLDRVSVRETSRTFPYFLSVLCHSKISPFTIDCHRT